MACHLKAVDLGVWRVTHDGMKPIKNLDKLIKSEEKEIHFKARAKNYCLNLLAWMCLTKYSL